MIYSTLKEIVVCSYNMLFDFFCKIYNFGMQQYVDLSTTIKLLFECFVILHNKNIKVCCGPYG